MVLEVIRKKRRKNMLNNWEELVKQMLDEEKYDPFNCFEEVK